MAHDLKGVAKLIYISAAAGVSIEYLSIKFDRLAGVNFSFSEEIRLSGLFCLVLIVQTVNFFFILLIENSKKRVLDMTSYESQRKAGASVFSDIKDSKKEAKELEIHLLIQKYSSLLTNFISFALPLIIGLVSCVLLWPAMLHFVEDLFAKFFH